MASQQPLVSIITLNWNGLQVTSDLLRSIRKQNTYSNIEVIVVDNASKEDPTAELKAIYPEAEILRTEKNLGFSGGNNVGIKAAKGEFFFIINNDTEFTPGLIEGLLEVFEKNEDAGVVSPKFHYFYSKGTIEYAGYKSVNIFTGRNGMVGCMEKDEGQYNEMTVTNYAHGGAMMVPAKSGSKGRTSS
jgi:GT2 family glycosyltransferase